MEGAVTTYIRTFRAVAKSRALVPQPPPHRRRPRPEVMLVHAGARLQPPVAYAITCDRGDNRPIYVRRVAKRNESLNTVYLKIL